MPAVSFASCCATLPPVIVNRGVSLANVGEFYARADGLLIGETDFKVGGVWGGASDGAAYAKAVRICRG